MLCGGSLLTDVSEVEAIYATQKEVLIIKTCLLYVVKLPFNSLFNAVKKSLVRKIAHRKVL